MDFQNAAMPTPHREFLRRAVQVLRRDERIIGIAVAGSLAEGGADEWSDVDLVIAVEPDSHPSVMDDRHRLAAELGDMAAAFTGEHVGDPRLLVCLYDNPALHVDLKFVPLPDAVPVVDNPVVLWARDDRLEAVLRQRVGAYPFPDRQWIEDRFWIWVHYLAGKIARGELFEAMEGLSFLRVTVLAPLGLANAGTSSSGVRRIEEKSPELADALAATVAGYDRNSLRTALNAAVTLYQRLRTESGEPVIHRRQAETVAVRAVAELETRAE